jgi:hypothetical protein
VPDNECNTPTLMVSSAWALTALKLNAVTVTATAKDRNLDDNFFITIVLIEW